MDRTAGSCDTLLHSLSNVPALTHLTLVISDSDSSLLAGCTFHHCSARHGVRWQKHLFSFSINWLTYLIAPFITRITQYTCCSFYYVIITNCIKMEKQCNSRFATSPWSQYFCIGFFFTCVVFCLLQLFLNIPKFCIDLQFSALSFMLWTLLPLYKITPGKPCYSAILRMSSHTVSFPLPYFFSIMHSDRVCCAAWHNLILTKAKHSIQ